MNVCDERVLSNGMSHALHRVVELADGVLGRIEEQSEQGPQSILVLDDMELGDIPLDNRPEVILQDLQPLFRRRKHDLWQAAKSKVIVQHSVHAHALGFRERNAIRSDLRSPECQELPEAEGLHHNLQTAPSQLRRDLPAAHLGTRSRHHEPDILGLVDPAEPRAPVRHVLDLIQHEIVDLRSDGRSQHREQFREKLHLFRDPFVVEVHIDDLLPGRILQKPLESPQDEVGLPDPPEPCHDDDLPGSHGEIAVDFSLPGKDHGEVSVEPRVVNCLNCFIHRTI